MPRLLALFAILYALFFFVLLGNAPLDGIDDYAHLAFAHQTSWPQLIHGFLSLEMPHNIYGQGVATHALSSRVAQTMILKAIYSLFSEYPFAYYFYQTLASMGCLLLIIYLAAWLTSNKWWGVFAGLYYFFLPCSWMHTLWVSDFSGTVHFLTLCFVLVFLKKHLRLQGATLFLLPLIAFTAFKVKPTGLAIPIITFIFFLDQAIQRLQKRKFWIYGICLIGLLAGIMAAHEMMPRTIDLSNIWRMTFKNGPNEFEPEKQIALFNLSAVVPVSLLRNVGGVLAWLAIFCIFKLLIQKQTPARPAARFVLIWLLTEIGLFAFSVGNRPRYLTDAMIPLILALSLLFDSFLKSLRSKTSKQIFVSVLLIGMIINLVNNFQHVIFIRHRNISWFVSTNDTVRIVYNDYHGLPLEKPLDYYTQVRFYMPDLLGEAPARPLLPDLMVRADVYDINKYLENPSTDKILAKYGRAYQITTNPIEEKSFSLIQSIQARPDSPLTNSLSVFKKKKNTDRLYIYRAEGPINLASS